MRAGGIIRLAAVLVGFAGVGCAGDAHYVVQRDDVCVVGVPSSSNSFPTYYRNQADELAKKQFPQGFVVGEAKLEQIGTVTTSRTNNDAVGIGPILVDQVVKTTTNTEALFEYRITYRPK